MDGRVKYMKRRLDNGETLRLEDQAWLVAEYERLWRALVEVDTYLANDPDVWRVVSVAKAGDVLCDALGPNVILSINSRVEALLCPRCLIGDRCENCGKPASEHGGPLFSCWP
jgi:hypothetical protein